MPNRADEYEYFIVDMKKYLASAQDDYNKSYNGGKTNFTATKEDAKNALENANEKELNWRKIFISYAKESADKKAE